MDKFFFNCHIFLAAISIKIPTMLYSNRSIHWLTSVLICDYGLRQSRLFVTVLVHLNMKQRYDCRRGFMFCSFLQVKIHRSKYTSTVATRVVCLLSFCKPAVFKVMGNDTCFSCDLQSSLWHSMSEPRTPVKLNV